MIAEIMQRSGALTAVPTALARMNGAMMLTRMALDRTPAPVAPSPSSVIHLEGAARLMRYEPLPGVAQKDPILLCPSLINRLYVLDLKEGISVVEQLRKAGHRVYGIDWGDPGPAEKGVSFEGFVQRLQQFLVVACADARVTKMHLLGHCLGGTMATALAATDDSRIHSLINLTAPMAFHDDGLLSKWTRAPFFDPTLVTRALGHVPAWLTQPAFQILKPMGQPSKALRLFQNLNDPKFLEFFRCLETWINDNVAIPDRFFEDLCGQLYRNNALVNGSLMFKSGAVRLENVKVPVLTIVASEDHIVPQAGALAGEPLFSSQKKQTEILPGGHIGVVVGGLARRRLWPTLLAWMASEVAQ
ncbi:MAG TPA: alpha/beta fold hydrolase [Myxococcota bacterium]|jgi:polyhydroxyalkanoate synthase